MTAPHASPGYARSMALPDARRSLLERLIDDGALLAGPAGDAAVTLAAYRQAREGEDGWMLGALACPASRFDELAGALADGDHAPIPCCLVMDGAGLQWRQELADTVERLFATLARVSGRIQICRLEIPVPAEAAQARRPIRLLGPFVAAIAEAREHLGLTSAGLYFEPPLHQMSSRRVRWMLRTLARLDAGVVARIGAVSRDRFPSMAVMAVTVESCARNRIPLAVTALQLPSFRGRDSRTGFHHQGLVNLVAAASFAHQYRLPLRRVAEILADEDPSFFHVTAADLRWRHLRAGPEAIDLVRRQVLVSVRSHSFASTVADLRTAGVMLPDDV